MATSSSSPRSSPQDPNLIRGRTRGNGDVWRSSVDGFHWNVGRVFATYRVTPVSHRAGSDMTRGLGGRGGGFWSRYAEPLGTPTLRFSTVKELFHPPVFAY